MIKQNPLFVFGMAAALFTGAISYSCNQAGAKQDTTQATEAPEVFPDLLNRNEALGGEHEKQQVQEITGALFTRLKQNPNDVDARLRLAEVYMLEARVTGEHGHYYPAALQMLNKALAAKPNPDQQFQALSLLTSVYLSLHQFDKALATGHQALKLNSHSAQIYGGLVDANVELGNYAEAVALCDKMISIRPDIRSYSRVSYLREIHGETQGAIEAMKLAVSAGYPGQEDQAWARLTLGNLYQNNGDLANAEAQYRFILIERPNYPFAIAALGGIEAKKGNTAEAEKLLKQACEIIPEVGFYEQLAALYLDSNRKPEADALVKEIFEMMADDEQAGHAMHLSKAHVHLALTNNLDEAISEAMIEYRMRPLNIDVNKTLAEAYYRKGNLEKASQHLQAANLTNSKDPQLLLLNGLAKMKEEKASGRALIRQSLEADPFQSGPVAREGKSALKPS